VLRLMALRSLVIMVCVGVGVLGLTLAGFAPLGGDPELMYLPIKSELSRALAANRLPFWSDGFGLGTPLVAESHVAAFYPPNWLLYRLCGLTIAFRLSIWLHLLALVAATFAYARVLSISRAGSALAAASFTLCGFQALHVVHEPFYHSMPYLPLCLLLADRYAATGRLAWLAGLALAWGSQITVGHFQIQMWTAGLVLLLGFLRVWADSSQVAFNWLSDKRSAGRSQALAARLRLLERSLGMFAGLCWGAAIAYVQLRLTWELTGASGFVRPPHLLANYSFPPTHLTQLALPEVFLSRPSGAGGIYLSRHGTTVGEASAYVGIIPWIMAFAGAMAVSRARNLAPWRLIVVLSLALATMPGWWPDGFLLFLSLPGVGWFRAPARYTLLASLGLALLAGRGLDHSIGPRRFWSGLVLAVMSGAAACALSINWMGKADFRTFLGNETLTLRFVAAGLGWGIGLAAIIAWRSNRLGAWAPISITVLELMVLFFIGPIEWGRPSRLADESTVLRRLAALPPRSLIAGRLFNLPVNAGQSTASPYLGITPPPPNYLLMSAAPPARNDEVERRWHRRFGVTHGVWGSLDPVWGTEILAKIADPALDRVLANIAVSGRGGLGPWKLVRTPDPFPSAWVARQTRKAPDWGSLFLALSHDDLPDEAWFLAEDDSPSLPGNAACLAGVRSWNGQTAVVEHDGACVLILQRTYYPGWVSRVDDGPEQPVLKVNGGLQGVALTGSGTSQVVMHYRPTGLLQASAVSLTALATAVLVLGTAGWNAVKSPSPRQ
jgi:hypothetical protein